MIVIIIINPNLYLLCQSIAYATNWLFLVSRLFRWATRTTSFVNYTAEIPNNIFIKQTKSSCPYTTLHSVVCTVRIPPLYGEDQELKPDRR